MAVVQLTFLCASFVLSLILSSAQLTVPTSPVLPVSDDFIDSSYGKISTSIGELRKKFLFTFSFELLLLSSSPASLLDMETGVDPSDTDVMCPRSREEAAARGRSCLRKCRTDADCISNRKRCLCDGLCGWSCVRPGL